MNYLAIALATVAAMVIGWLWYGPVFGKPWRAVSGVGDRKQPHPGVMYGLTLVASFATAWSLAWLSAHANPFAVAGIAWLGFSAARALIVTLFEARPIRLFLINTGHNLAVAVAMAAIIGVLGS